MNIAQIIHAFPPESVGGSEFYLLALCQELEKRHQISVFYRVADAALPEYRIVKETYQGLPVYKLNHTFREADSFEKSYRDQVIDREFGRFLDEVRPDVLHVHHLTCLSTTMLGEARARGIPVVYTLHDYWLMCHLGQLLTREMGRCDGPSVEGCLQCLAPQIVQFQPGYQQLSQRYHALHTPLRRILSPLKGIVKRLAQWLPMDGLDGNHELSGHVETRLQHFKALLTQVDLLIAPSSSLRERFIRFGASPEKIRLVRNGYQTSLFDGHRRTTSTRLRFGYIGTLLLSKGVHVLAEAFNGIQEDEIELKIYGDFVPYHFFESYPDYLKGLITNPRVRLMGGFRHDEISRILEEIDVVVVPSIWYENLPLTIQEAFLAGIPVVASNVGGMADLVQDGVNGLLFQVGDPHDLRRVIRRLIDHRELLDQLRSGIPAVIPMERHAEELEQIYQELCSVAAVSVRSR